ncbi:MAG: site-specific integrase [Bacteroidota bacterium]
MASIKVLLWKKKKTNKTHPIVIRIIKDRKPSYIYTGQYIEEKYWDEKNRKIKKSHPNSAWLNNFIAKQLAEANDKLLELQSSKERVTAQNITKQVKTTISPTSFFDLAKTYINQLEANGKFNRVNAEKPRIKHFREFLKGRDIAFSEISEVLLKKFQSYLRTNRGVSERTIVNHLIVIRTIFNLAIREGIVERKYYPFGKGRIVIKFPQSIKLGLSSEELTALEEIDLTDFPSEAHARNVWLFSFYFAGMRISDVFKLKWSDFKDGRLYYQMGKNTKVLSLKVADKALAILQSYAADKSSNEDFIFPELKKANLEDEKDIFRKVSNGTKVLNKHLKRIAEKLELDKPITTHIARHTFGNISGDRIPVQMLQKLYRHSDITTTINYQKAFIFKDADDALDAVLNS